MSSNLQNQLCTGLCKRMLKEKVVMVLKYVDMYTCTLSFSQMTSDNVSSRYWYTENNTGDIRPVRIYRGMDIITRLIFIAVFWLIASASFRLLFIILFNQEFCYIEIECWNILIYSEIWIFGIFHKKLTFVWIYLLESILTARRSRFFPIRQSL